MRISDWSSDVCSSDLHLRLARDFIGRDATQTGRDGKFDVRKARDLGRADRAQPFEEMVAHPVGHEARGERQAQHAALLVEPVVLERAQPALKGAAAELVAQPRAYLRPDLLRSEEHTSELQSLMRNSYAV